jgi:alpha-glucosidase
VVEVMDKVARVADDGWACWAFSNHDVMRHASRWSLSPAAQRGMTTLLMCLRGSACIYQGEELGLHEADVAFEDLQDPYGIQFWPEFKGRDGCRTPMVWTADNLNGGFSDARPWLPVSSEQLRNAVGEQEKHPDALLHHYRRAIAFRHAHPALASGTLEDLHAEGDVVSFVRRGDGETIYVALNLRPGGLAPHRNRIEQRGACAVRTDNSGALAALHCAQENLSHRASTGGGTTWRT